LSRDSESKTVPNEADGIFYYELDELGWPQDRKVFALAIALGQGPIPRNGASPLRAAAQTSKIAWIKLL
jgi:hypothetical protein